MNPKRYRKVIGVACPTCDAQPGHSCTEPDPDNARGGITCDPHPARTKAAFAGQLAVRTPADVVRYVKMNDGKFYGATPKCEQCKGALPDGRTKYCSFACSEAARMIRRRERDAEAGKDPLKTTDGKERFDEDDWGR